MNKLVLAITALLIIPVVLADGWDMMSRGYGMMGGGMTGLMAGSFIGIIYFAVFSFVFSIIFWQAYNWVVKEKKK